MTLNKKILQDIDSHIESKYAPKFRTYFGVSKIGETCPRALWYSFRWMYLETFTARTLRLFQRGHREESTFAEYLTGIGFKVESVDPETGEQYAVLACKGHLGSSIDGKGYPPEHYKMDPVILLEYKTKGTGSPFNKLAEQGVRATNPIHWAQICAYGVLGNFNQCLYLSVNKNDDSLAVDFVELDKAHGEKLIARAESIIFSRTPPPRLEASEAKTTCNFCPARRVCANTEVPLKNCRSCNSATPVENSAWYCEKWNCVIPENALEAGCGSHTFIKND